MEHRMFHRKLHYFDWAMFNSYFDITKDLAVGIITLFVAFVLQHLETQQSAKNCHFIHSNMETVMV